jgi:hypothetical protein
MPRMSLYSVCNNDKQPFSPFLVWTLKKKASCLPPHKA